MEYGHGFAPSYQVAPVMREMAVFNTNFNFLFNLFQPVTLGLNATNKPQSARYDQIMLDIFGCEPFSNGLNTTLDFREAADRITYTAANFVHSPMGNVLHYVGTFVVVLRPKYIEDMMLITPSDSFHFEAEYPKCKHWTNCTGSSPFCFDHAHKKRLCCR